MAHASRVADTALRMNSDLPAAEAAFLSDHPAYAATGHIDALRRSEYGRFDSQGHTYLDYTGAGVYSESQVRMHLDLLARSIAGNPRSDNLSTSQFEWAG